MDEYSREEEVLEHRVLRPPESALRAAEAYCRILEDSPSRQEWLSIKKRGERLYEERRIGKVREQHEINQLLASH